MTSAQSEGCNQGHQKLKYSYLNTVLIGRGVGAEVFVAHQVKSRWFPKFPKWNQTEPMENHQQGQERNGHNSGLEPRLGQDFSGFTLCFLQATPRVLLPKLMGINLIFKFSSFRDEQIQIKFSLFSPDLLVWAAWCPTSITRRNSREIPSHGTAAITEKVGLVWIKEGKAEKK